MLRTSGDEKETLRQSADAAGKLLVKLRAARANIDERITKLQAVVDAYESISGKRTKADASDSDSKSDLKKRAPKGQVPSHIDALLEGGMEYDEPTLRKKIQERFNVAYGRATLYTCLRRGAEAHKYVKNGTKWSLNPLRVVQVQDRLTA